MKISKCFEWPSALCLSALMLQAQETFADGFGANASKQSGDGETNEVEQLKKQMQQMQQQIEMLRRKLEELTKSHAPPLAAATKTDEQKKLEEQLAAELARGATTNATSENVRPSAESKQPWSPSQPITIARAGSAYMNFGFDVLLDAGWSTAADPSALLQLGDHDPHKRGVTLPNAEISLDGAVDPYFKGFANIVFKLDNDNETEVELEEAYLVSTSLPANLQLKAGQFFANFGRQNPQHPHSWAFVDQPIILNRAFGPDGLRNLGAQVSWLAPTAFYTEVFLGILDGQGGTAFSFRNQGDDDGTGVHRFAGRATTDRHLRGPQDMVFNPRIASSFEITDTQTIVAGLSGAFGANDTGPHSRTEIYGADIYWKWKPANASKGFPFVSWQTEALYRRFGAGADPLAPTPLPAENLKDWGVYSQVLWGFKPRWVAGIRGDYASGNSGVFDPNDPFRGERYRVSPALTFYPSEFSKMRLQYNHDHGEFIGTEHSVWLQLEFMLGAHAAHKF